jgi:hypothetical protein
MPARKLLISRGFPQDTVVPIDRARAASAESNLVLGRLEALERLVRLRDQNVLTPQEFAAEKALVLGLAAADASPPPPAHTPALAARLFDWRLLLAGTAAGLALSWYSAPQDLLGLLDRAARILG